MATTNAPSFSQEEQEILKTLASDPQTPEEAIAYLNAHKRRAEMVQSAGNIQEAIAHFQGRNPGVPVDEAKVMAALGMKPEEVVSRLSRLAGEQRVRDVAFSQSDAESGYEAFKDAVANAESKLKKSYDVLVKANATGTMPQTPEAQAAVLENAQMFDAYTNGKAQEGWPASTKAAGQQPVAKKVAHSVLAFDNGIKQYYARVFYEDGTSETVTEAQNPGMIAQLKANTQEDPAEKAKQETLKQEEAEKNIAEKEAKVDVESGVLSSGTIGSGFVARGALYATAIGSSLGMLHNIEDAAHAVRYSLDDPDGTRHYFAKTQYGVGRVSFTPATEGTSAVLRGTQNMGLAQALQFYACAAEAGWPSIRLKSQIPDADKTMLFVAGQLYNLIEFKAGLTLGAEQMMGQMGPDGTLRNVNVHPSGMAIDPNDPQLMEKLAKIKQDLADGKVRVLEDITSQTGTFDPLKPGSRIEVTPELYALMERFEAPRRREDFNGLSPNKAEVNEAWKQYQARAKQLAKMRNPDLKYEKITLERDRYSGKMYASNDAINKLILNLHDEMSADVDKMIAKYRMTVEAEAGKGMKAPEPVVDPQNDASLPLPDIDVPEIPQATASGDFKPIEMSDNKKARGPLGRGFWGKLKALGSNTASGNGPTLDDLKKQPVPQGKPTVRPTKSNGPGGVG